MLVGNPPWLAYGFMTLGMKRDFRLASKARNIWPVSRTARNPDLSAYFVARSIENYLRADGSFGFVMPNAVLSRQQYQGFRSGNFKGESTGNATVSYEKPWDLADIKPNLFPVPSCAVLGRLTPNHARPLPTETIRWSGSLPRASVSWKVAEPLLQAEAGTSVVAVTGSASPYAQRFDAGVNIRPRALLCVEKAPAGPLGVGAGRTKVRSRRSSQEKAPWKSVPTLEGVVESQFVRPVHLGSTVARIEPWILGLQSSHGTGRTCSTAIALLSTTIPVFRIGGVEQKESGLGTTSREHHSGSLTRSTFAARSPASSQPRLSELYTRSQVLASPRVAFPTRVPSWITSCTGLRLLTRPKLSTYAQY